MNHQGWAKSGVHLDFEGASSIHKLLLTGHQELCTGNNTDLIASEECIEFQDFKTLQIGMYLG
jgi:hypothetical protein